VHKNTQQDVIIISDTTCLIAFTNVNKLDVLKQTYKNIEITPYVKEEYEKRKGDIIPDWIIIKEPKDIEFVNRLKKDFGAGESQSIVLAVEEKENKNNVKLILDDSEARNFAINIELNVTGTLGVINKARKEDIISLNEAIEIVKTMKTNKFYLSDKLLNNFIEEMKIDNEKKKQ